MKPALVVALPLAICLGAPAPTPHTEPRAAAAPVGAEPAAETSGAVGARDIKDILEKTTMRKDGGQCSVM